MNRQVYNSMLQWCMQNIGIKYPASWDVDGMQGEHSNLLLVDVAQVRLSNHEELGHNSVFYIHFVSGE